MSDNSCVRPSQTCASVAPRLKPPQISSIRQRTGTAAPRFARLPYSCVPPSHRAAGSAQPRAASCRHHRQPHGEQPGKIARVAAAHHPGGRAVHGAVHVARHRTARPAQGHHSSSAAAVQRRSRLSATPGRSAGSRQEAPGVSAPRRGCSSESARYANACLEVERDRTWVFDLPLANSARLNSNPAGRVTLTRCARRSSG